MSATHDEILATARTLAALADRGEALPIHAVLVLAINLTAFASWVAMLEEGRPPAIGSTKALRPEWRQRAGLRVIDGGRA